MTHKQINQAFVGLYGHDHFIVTRDFLPLLTTLIEEEERRLSRPDFEEFDAEAGILYHIARRVSSIFGNDEDGNPIVTEEAFQRRFYDIRNERTPRTRIKWYDALLIALNATMSEQEIPIFPAGKQAAWESVDAFCEDWMPSQKKRLAQSMLNFARGYCYAMTADEDVCMGEAQAEPELIAA